MVQSKKKKTGPTGNPGTGLVWEDSTSEDKIIVGAVRRNEDIKLIGTLLKPGDSTAKDVISAAKLTRAFIKPALLKRKKSQVWAVKSSDAKGKKPTTGNIGTGRVPKG